MASGTRTWLALLLVGLMVAAVVPYGNDTAARDMGSSPVGPFPGLPPAEYWDMAWTPNAEYAAIVGEDVYYMYYESGDRLVNYSDRIGGNYFRDVEFSDYWGSMLMVGNNSGGEAIVDRFAYEPSGSVLEWYDGSALTSAGDYVSVTGDDGVWDRPGEYVYLTQTSAPSSVSGGDTRLVDTPAASFVSDEHGGGYILSYTLEKMPVAEQILCNYSALSTEWTVWGSVSGHQVQSAATDTSYTLDTGANAGKVSFTISGSPSDGDYISINITVDPRGYPARTQVSSADSDVDTPLNVLSKASYYNTYEENYVIDANSDGTLNEGDVRITAFAEDINYYTYSSVSASYHDVVFNSSDGERSGLAVGTGGLVTYLDLMGGTPVDMSIPGNADFYGVAMQESSSTFFIVGGNSTQAFAYAMHPDPAVPEDTVTINMTSDIPTSPCCLINIAWNQRYDYGIAVGENSVLRLDYDPLSHSYSWSVLASEDSAFFQAVEWTDDYETAIIGDGKGNIWRYDNGGSGVYEKGGGAASQIFGIAIRPRASSPYATAVGTNGAVNYYYTTSSSSTNIIANVDIPTINDYDIENSAGLSILNAMTDVDSTYMFYIDAYYVSSFNTNMWDRVNIDIYAWNDLNDARAAYPAELVNNSCTAFRLNYTGGSNGAATGTWTVAYPLAGPDNYEEVSIVNQSESFAVEADGYEHHYLFINVSFGPQLRYSSNTAMTDIGDTSESLGYNDADTWNMEIRAVDSTLPLNKDSKYTEFGLYKYTSITVSGNPSGSSPPGQHVVLTNPSRVFYAANIDYWVYVQITNLTSGNGDIIPATSVSAILPDAEAADSQLYSWTYFPGANTEMTVWDIPDAPYLGGNGTFGEFAAGTLLPYVEYPSHSVVSSDDYDAGRILYNPPPFCRVTGANDTWESGEYIYIDKDNDYTVTEGDVRVTAYGPYPAGSIVNAGDTDLGVALSYLSNARISGIDDGRWNHGVDEFIIDTDSSWNISPGDLRVGLTPLVSGVYWALDIPAGTPRGSYTATITYTIYHP